MRDPHPSPFATLPTTRPLRLLGTGVARPARLVTADQVDATLDGPAGWTAEKTGVLRRYYVTDETASGMAATAARQAMDEADVAPATIDLIISASATREQLLPCTAALIQRALGWNERAAACFDVDATCVSFLVGLDIAAAMLAAGRGKRALVVTSEVASVGLDATHRESFALFGDGAAAAVVEIGDDPAGPGILAAHVETHSAFLDLAQIPHGGTRHYPTSADFDANLTRFQMEGRPLYAISARLVPPFLERAFASLPGTYHDCDLVIPHQASGPGLALMQRRLAIPDARFVNIIADYGNQIAASLPTALHLARRDGRLKSGDTACMIGTAGGYTLGALVLRV